MKLTDLLAGFNTDLQIETDLVINGLSLDSRALEKGNLFIALAGSKQHGLAHAQPAIAKGASAIIYDPAGTGKELAAELQSTVPMYALENLGKVLGNIAARFYGDPSSLMTVIGITGTNGKTSCSQFLSQVLDHCGIIGTLGWGEWRNLHKTVNTTPDALAIQNMFSKLLTSGKKTLAMEVSSHGLEQGRVNGAHFKGAVFTNISRDHLDYHGSMENYLQAKLILLQTPGLAFVVVNLDDAYSEQILAAVPGSVQVWGVTHTGRALSGVHEQIVAENIVNNAIGIEFNVRWRNETHQVTVPLYGDFNVENVLCVLGVMLALDVPLSVATKKLAKLQAVAGRMQRFGGDGQPLVFVDYAHTPDALDKVLASVKKHCEQDLWAVFGCGGNRDTGKRPQMGACAEHWADHVILTDDNPRFENGLDIVNAILTGCKEQQKIEIIQNREHAIQSAIARAGAGDCIVIAGKGHEDYQEINGKTYPFRDSDCVMNALKTRIE